MRIEYRTNIDCCKPFLTRLNNLTRRLSNLVTIPNIDEYVRIIDETDKVIDMHVLEKTWKYPEDDEVVCEIYLGASRIWREKGLDALEKFIKNRY